MLREHAAVPISVDGPPGLHLGVFRQPGRLLIHVQNFIPWSGAEQFPNPVLTAPDPVSGVELTLRGTPVQAVRQLVPERIEHFLDFLEARVSGN